MNARQKNIVRSWRQVFGNLVKREWFSLFISSSLGVLAAEAVHLVLWDSSFQAFLQTKYKSAILLDDPRYYVTLLVIVVGTIVVASAPSAIRYAGRGLRSWCSGVTSGLVLLPFSSTLLFSLLPSSLVPHRVIFCCIAVSFWLGVAFALHLAAVVRSERSVQEDECAVPSSVRSRAGTQLVESDDPIQSWEQDALGRAALVDSLSVKILIGKAPVLALSGPFGSGKTSTLNLLREHLGDKTITVSFSSWLPGSQATLTSYLLADIATECGKQYVVPGLRRSARRFATALGQRVPLLSDYLKLMPLPTQKDDIENLKSGLMRLPKRVVVLLDEIDRMEKDELTTLLKVIRGISTLPNLSFVCAGDRNTIIETVREEVNDKSNEYFEKFYPVLIQIPEPNPEVLRKAGTERLLGALVSRSWFGSRSEEEDFRQQINQLWNERIAPFCSNLRAIGSLANDLGISAAALRREVDPIDLTFIELLRRFRPAVYGIVARNSLTLTGGETLVRGGPYQSDEDRKRNESQLLADLKKAARDDTDLEQVKGVLCELFPDFLKTDRRLRPQRPRRKDPNAEGDRRISEASMFPAYFRYELPEAIFSSVELASLEQRLETAPTQAALEKVYTDALQLMERGSLKRDDFLRKVANRAKHIPESVATSLARAAAKASTQYTYDVMPGFGEAGHVLRMIHQVALRFSHTSRVAFLQQCILASTDDTMAFNIFGILTNQKDEDDLKVAQVDLYGSFASRMRKRYGRDVDASNFDLSASDAWALEYWGRDLTKDGISSDPEDRNIQHDFWLRVRVYKDEIC